MKEAERVTGVSAKQLQEWEARIKALDALTHGHIETLVTGGSNANLQFNMRDK